MIKRFILTLVSVLCLVFPASANVKISADSVDTIIKKYFTTEKDRASALATFNKNLAKDGSIPASAVWKVCSAGGLNIQDTTGKKKCQDFKSELVRNSTFKTFEVCGKYKGKTGGTEYCIDDFFTNKIYGGTQVNMTPAIKLAQEYARVKHKDTTVQCSSKPREISVLIGAKDYGVKCVSRDKNVYYEFIFDDVKESVDNTIKNSIQNAICKLYDAESVASGCTPSSQPGISQSCWSSYCKTNETTCKKINTSMAKFGYVASYNKGKCEIDFNTLTKATDLKTAFGIDNFVFCRGIQVQNAPSAEAALKQYIVAAAKKQGSTITEGQINCSSGFNTYTGKGCNVNGITDFKDDIKTCNVGNKQIDFVFDDVNESWNSYHAGGVQAMTCMTKDGIFDGENCVGLVEQQCKELRSASLKNCPECKEIMWDAEKGLCVLPSSKSASNLQKGINYGTLAVTVVVGTGITVASGGTAGAGVFVVVAKIGTGAMLAGAGAKLSSEAFIKWGLFQPFVEKAQKCISSGDSGCAEEIVTKDLQKYMSYKSDFSQAEAKALDEIFAKLVEKIPADSEFWDDFANNPDLWDCTEDGQTCRIKEKTQFLQYASAAGDIMMIAGSLMRAIGVVGTQTMTKTTETVYKKCDLIVKDVAGPGKPQNLRVAYMDGIGVDKGGTFVPNSQLAKLGLTGSGNKAAAELLVKNGTKIGVPFTQTTTEALGTATNTVITNTMVPTINAAALAGGALTQAHQLVPGRDDNSFYITRPGTNVEIPNRDDNNGGAGNLPGDSQPSSENPVVVAPTPGSVTPTPTLVPTPGQTPVETPSPVPVVAPISRNDKPTTFTPDKQKNVGLIVGLTAAGLVATGAIVGGVVAANAKDKKSGAVVQDTVDADIEQILHNANGVLGTVGDNQVRLVPLPTTVNTEAKLVDVDGNAVAVVEYRGYKLPYFIKNGKWTPLLGIGETGRWFNVYPKANTDIKTIDMITDLMNRQINPGVVSRYVGVNASGVSLPIAAQAAFAIINAEFPNGVVQHENMTAQDAKLYLQNYDLIKSKLK